jgi:hypothetical protein
MQWNKFFCWRFLDLQKHVLNGAFPYLICVCDLQAQMCNLWFVMIEVWERVSDTNDKKVDPTKKLHFCVSNWQWLPKKKTKMLIKLCYLKTNMMPSSWTLRLLLFKMSMTGDCLQVAHHSRYRKEILNSLSEEEHHRHSQKIPCASLLLATQSP